jgi:hypothetical protein
MAAGFHDFCPQPRGEIRFLAVENGKEGHILSHIPH